MKRRVAALACLAATPSYADWSLDFVRIACIPESRMLRVEHVAVDGGDALTDSAHDDRLRGKRLAAWKRAGFHDPARLRYECRMAQSTYRIEARQPPPRERGMCGAAPRITLTLLRDGKPLVKEVTFGNDCFGEPSVARIEVFDGLEGWGSRNMTLCIRPRGRDIEAEVCRWRSATYVDIANAEPIVQHALPALIEAAKPK